MTNTHSCEQYRDWSAVCRVRFQTSGWLGTPEWQMQISMILTSIKWLLNLYFQQDLYWSCLSCDLTVLRLKTKTVTQVLLWFSFSSFFFFTLISLFSPDAIEMAGLPPVHPDKVAVASIPESILTRSSSGEERGAAAAAAAGRRKRSTACSSSSARDTKNTQAGNFHDSKQESTVEIFSFSCFGLKYCAFSYFSLSNYWYFHTM